MLPDHSPRTRNFGEWQPIGDHQAAGPGPAAEVGQVDEADFPLDFPLEAGAEAAGVGVGVGVDAAPLSGLSDLAALSGVSDDDPPESDPPESDVAGDDSLVTDAVPPDRLSVL